MDGDSLTAATQRLYEALALRNPALAFLNFGYDDGRRGTGEMSDVDVAAASRRLYEVTLAGVNRVERAIEIGCGRGAGAIFALTEKAVGTYVGVDLSPEHARLCRRLVREHSNAEFVVADVRQLPVATGACDVAFSVEAAQHFEDRPRCFAEIARTLRVGGRFYLAAIWRAGEVESPEVLAACGLHVVEHQVITPQVVRSLSRSSQVRRRAVDVLQWPDHLRPTLLSFVGVQGAEIYQWFVTGQLEYHRFVLERLPDGAA